MQETRYTYQEMKQNADIYLVVLLQDQLSRNLIFVVEITYPLRCSLYKKFKSPIPRCGAFI